MYHILRIQSFNAQYRKNILVSKISGIAYCNYCTVKDYKRYFKHIKLQNDLYLIIFSNRYIIDLFPVYILSKSLVIQTDNSYYTHHVTLDNPIGKLLFKCVFDDVGIKSFDECVDIIKKRTKINDVIDDTLPF